MLLTIDREKNREIRVKKLLLVLAFLIVSNNSHALPDCPSDESSHWHNCFGVLAYPSGDMYVGEFRDGKKHGQGTYEFANGETHVGEFKDDNYVGQDEQRRVKDQRSAKEQRRAEEEQLRELILLEYRLAQEEQRRAKEEQRRERLILEEQRRAQEEQRRAAEEQFRELILEEHRRAKEELLIAEQQRKANQIAIEEPRKEEEQRTSEEWHKADQMAIEEASNKGKIEIDAQLLDDCKIDYQITNNADFTLSYLVMEMIAFNEFGMPIAQTLSAIKVIRKNKQISGDTLFPYFPKPYSCDDVTRFEIYIADCLKNDNKFSTTDCVNSIAVKSDLLPQLTKLETAYQLTLKRLGLQDTEKNTCWIWYRFNNHTDLFPISYHFELDFIDIYDGYGGNVDSGFVSVAPNSSALTYFVSYVPCDEIKDIKVTSKRCATNEGRYYGYCPGSVKIIP